MKHFGRWVNIAAKTQWCTYTFYFWSYIGVIIRGQTGLLWNTQNCLTGLTLCPKSTTSGLYFTSATFELQSMSPWKHLIPVMCSIIFTFVILFQDLLLKPTHQLSLLHKTIQHYCLNEMNLCQNTNILSTQASWLFTSSKPLAFKNLHST